MVVIGLCITSGALTLLYRGDFLYPFIFTFIAALVIPLRAVSLINKLLDTNPIFTEQRTFTFRHSGYTRRPNNGLTRHAHGFHQGTSC
jgi:hypothetical protein